MITEYCCREFEKAVEYNNFRYYRPEDDIYNTIKKAGWYFYNASYGRPLVSLAYCPWCSKEVRKK